MDNPDADAVGCEPKSAQPHERTVGYQATRRLWIGFAIAARFSARVGVSGGCVGAKVASESQRETTQAVTAYDPARFADVSGLGVQHVGQRGSALDGDSSQLL